MKIALGAFAKMENLYLREWVEYHLALGFHKIYIYDNNDADGEDCADVLDGIDNVEVVYDLRGVKSMGCVQQVSAYNRLYQRLSAEGECDYVLFLDIDEFFTLAPKFGTVDRYFHELFRTRPQAVRFHQIVYNANGQGEYQDKPVVERFKERCSDSSFSRVYKNAYLLGCGIHITNVHYPERLATLRNSRGDAVAMVRSSTADTYCLDNAWIRHYITKSAEEYCLLKACKADSKKYRYNANFFFKYNQASPVFRAVVEHYVRYPEESRLYDYAIKKHHLGLESVTQPTPQIEKAEVRVEVPKYEEKQEWEDGVSVCVTAWHAQDYIEECLDSIANQSWFKMHRNWEILLGIDACEMTLAKVKGIKHKYKNLKVYMMSKNVGTYTTTNTLMSKAKYSWLLRFDSDDVMFPYMVAVMMSERADADRLRPYAVNFGRRDDALQDRHGCIMVKHSVFTKYGGYRPWTCAADGEFQQRLENFIKTKFVTRVVFKRRMHTENLTVKKETGMKSALRLEYKKRIVSPSSEEEAVIPCETAPCYEVGGESLSNPFIVSLTSYPARFAFLPKVIESIKKNTIQPEKVVLTLSRADYRYVTKDMLEMEARGDIEFLIVDDDLKPHNKYYYVMCQRRDVPIITVDDDCEYSPYLFETLFNSYKRFPDCVSAARVHKKTYIGDKVDKYSKWEKCCKKIKVPSSDLVATGVGGVLYPPDILHVSDKWLDTIKEHITVDDIVLHYYERMNGVEVVWADNALRLEIPNLIRESNSTAMYLTVNRTKNDEAITHLL